MIMRFMRIPVRLGIMYTVHSTHASSVRSFFYLVNHHLLITSLCFSNILFYFTINVKHWQTTVS